jgi:tetrapyrrole methylase family protein / MazG family protein
MKNEKGIEQMNEYTFEELVVIMKRLRRECPWDKAQTHDSIKGHTIEEAYEVVEAIDHKQYDELSGELGDLLLHVVFHAEIADGDGRFTIHDVLRGIIDKLTRRHPHIFGDVTVENADDVKRNWEQIKMSEGRESVIDGIPDVLPALLKAHRMQEKASKIGFDWPHRDDVWKKVNEEIAELQDALEQPEHEKVEEEFGDLLFALVNYARFVDVNPEDALRKTINKFSSRFRHIERRFREEGKDIAASSLEEMDRYWDEAKEIERSAS